MERLGVQGIRRSGSFRYCRAIVAHAFAGRRRALLIFLIAGITHDKKLNQEF